MNETLISACQMFMIPATILFGALGVAHSYGLKLLVCIMGVATTRTVGLPRMVLD